MVRDRTHDPPIKVLVLGCTKEVLDLFCLPAIKVRRSVIN